MWSWAASKVSRAKVCAWATSPPLYRPLPRPWQGAVLGTGVVLLGAGWWGNRWLENPKRS